MNKIKIIGLGPGNKDYIIPKALKEIKRADVIVGGERNIKSVNIKGKQVYKIDKNLKACVEYIKKMYISKNVAVIVSGDVGFYSLLRYLKKHFKLDEIEVIPGISSVQYMFARIKKSWEDAYIGSLHGREENFITKVKEYEKVCLLTDNKWTPKRIADELINNNLSDRTMYVGENLSYVNEKITKAKPDEIIKRDNYDMSVVVIANE